MQIPVTREDVDFLEIYRESENYHEFVERCLTAGATEDEAVNIYHEITSKYEEPWPISK